MNKKEIQQKLEYMQGKTFTYAGSIHYIKDFQIDDVNEKFKVITNLNSFDRSFESAKEFLSYWSEALTMNQQVPAPPENNQIDKFIENESNLADEMINILKDNILKVKADAGYIKQAQTINNNVNSIINVAKMKIDFVKQTRRK